MFFYDIETELTAIEQELVAKVTAEAAKVQQVDEHGSVRIIFSRSTVTVTYKEGKICDIRDGHKEWNPEKAIHLINLLDVVMEQEPKNPLARIAHTQRLGHLHNEIADRISYIFDWIGMM